MSLADARRLARRCPAWRRRDPDLPRPNGTGEGAHRNHHRWPRACDRWREEGVQPSLRSAPADRLVVAVRLLEWERSEGAGSSAAFLLSVNHAGTGGGGTGNGSIRITGQAVRYFEAGRLGGLAQGQGESGRAGSGWPKHRRLPQGPEEQSVQGLEPDVVGLLLSASGARGGDRKAARRGEAHTRHPHRGRPHRPNGGGQAPGGTGGTGVPPRLLWLPPGAAGARRGRDGEAAVLAVRLGDRSPTSGRSSTPSPGSMSWPRSPRTPTPPGCCCMSSGGWPPRCSNPTGRGSSGTGELRRALRSRRCWRTCSATTHSTSG